MNSDLVLINGSVLTMDRERPRAQAVAIRNGRVAVVGSNQEAIESGGSRARVINLQGRTATPGLNDAHAHPMGVGFALADLDIANPPCGSIADMVELVREKTTQVPAGTWIVGRGYDQGRLDDRRHPNRGDLDDISPNHPVLLIRACHHIAVANSTALRAAGVTRNTPDPDGGTIDRGEGGEPNGVLRETAFEMVRSVLGKPSEEDIARALELGGQAFLATGVTSVGEAGIHRPEELQAYQHLRSEHRLPVRTYLMMIIDETLEHMISLGIRTGFGDDMLRIGPAKLFSDGSIGAKTARMRQPYLGTESNFGLWMQDPSKMKAKVLQAHAAGFQLGIHAIGDAAIDLILDAYEEANHLFPRANSRHRIEHCEIVDLETIKRIARLGVVPVPGTTFIRYFRDVYLQNLEIGQLRYADGMATFKAEGVIAAASSDAPVVPVSAPLGLQTMMTRHDVLGNPLWVEESIGLHDALRAYTVNGAYASFEESTKGTLAPGMLGDIAVFETDLEQVEASEIGSVNIDHTILGGEVVYSRAGA